MKVSVFSALLIALSPQVGFSFSSSNHRLGLVTSPQTPHGNPPYQKPNRDVMDRLIATNNHQTRQRSSLKMTIDASSTTEMLSFLDTLSLTIDRDQAEALAGPFFG
jgi:hypothetical protein